MDVSTILLLLLSLIASGALAFYQYFYPVKNGTRLRLLLAFLRFAALFGVCLLLINPTIRRSVYETQKTPLPVVLDNSASVAELKADGTARALFQNLISNPAIRDKFDLQPYVFDADLRTGDSADFRGRQTDLEAVAKNLKSINRNKVYPTVLITDGNQTQGNDFLYSFDRNNKVFPLVLGDTTSLTDLRISRINLNRYAFKNNKFPVEVFVQYAGNKSLKGSFAIQQGRKLIEKQEVNFSPSQRSAVINVLLQAEKTGLQFFKAVITSTQKEKNTYNNVKNFAVEVLDQKSEIALISAIGHPDIGALKRAIESNQQRKVTVLKPKEINSLQNYNVLILYQPTAEFKPVYEANKKAGINTFTVAGPNTDFDFLNQQQKTFAFRMSGQYEDYLPVFNEQFNLFAMDDLGFGNFPPLRQAFGNVAVNGKAEVLLFSSIRNMTTNMPLLCFSEEQGKRAAFLMGEGIWKWRLQSHLDQNSFEKFDLFADKIMQFLASNNARTSLVVHHERFYNSGDAITVTAQYFNKNYEFDEKARLMISVTHKETKQIRHYDMLRGGNAFEANFDGFAAGHYTFTVKELNSGSVYSGAFDILDFDIEKQFVNPDYSKLSQLADNTKGKVFLPKQVDQLIKILLDDPRYKAVQKEISRQIPLIDSVLLLVLIALLLAAEWFIRKYNGLL